MINKKQKKLPNKLVISISEVTKFIEKLESEIKL